MNTNNQQSSVSPREKTKNAIIWVLSVAWVATMGYLIFSQKESTETIHNRDVQISSLMGEKSSIQGSFDASLARLDSMNILNGDLKHELSDKNEEITKVKSEIRIILNKKNASQAELNKAKTLVASLNEKIAGMEQEISRLTLANENLTQEKNTLIAEKGKLTTDLNTTTSAKNQLEHKVDVASTLNASSINIVPLNVKSSGKEVVSSKAKKVDKFLVSFIVDNRIVQPGTTDVYVLVLGPDGKPVTNGETGTFSTRENGDKQYTAKLPVELETAKKKNVEFSFTSDNFQQGNYTIQVYQNGYLIGEGTRSLKKSGLFS
jgi:hypothetical protein